MKKTSSIMFFPIIALAILLRFFQLSSIPPSLTWDEVSWGYNAYSLGMTGHDEFGKFLPITYLESFGDFKPPLYAYLDILPVKLLGLNEFATRFPSAFFGVLSVILTYFFVLEIFGKNKKNLALLSSFMLAISPWHIMLSRAAFEANVAQFFVLLALFLFFKSLEKRHYLLIFSVLSFVASMYTFNSARIVVPILILILSCVYYKVLIKTWRETLASIFIGFIIFFPLCLFLNTPQAKLRFNEVNIFSDSSVIERVNQQIKNDGNSQFSKLIHNRRFAYGVEYARHYLDNFVPQFLFIRGDGNPKFSIQDVGQLYIWEIPFLVIGFLILFRKKDGAWWIVPVMLVVGIIPAGFARETPHALRIENVIPSFQIITALGIISVISLIPKNLKKITTIILSFIIASSIIYFAHNYLTHYSNEFSGEWQYGYRESVDYILKEKDKYASIYVTEALGRPYIYYLFYMKYDPSKFAKEAKIYRETLGFVHVNKFSNIVFTDKIAQIKDKNALYVSSTSDKPLGAKILKEFKLLNVKKVLVAYTL